MTFKRVLSGLAPSYLVDAVRARRMHQQQLQDARLAQVRSAREAAARAARESAEHLSSWDEACMRARAGGYETKGLTQFRIARARLHLPDGSLLQSNILGLVAMLVGRPDLAITDFGGSTGELGADLLLRWPDARYCVVENLRLVALMQDDAMRPGVNFATEMPAACDIFYSSGALQYVADPLDVWARGLASSRHAAILRRNNFAADELFDVQQSQLFENGHGAVPEGFADTALAYPRRTLNESRILAIAQAQGFRCVANLDDSEQGAQGRYSRQLVFWRGSAGRLSALARMARAVRGKL